MEQGKVTEVTITYAQAEVMTAAAVAATTVYVDDVSDFDENGGQVQIGDDIYDYLTVVDLDDDTDDEPESYITLATGLLVALEPADKVFLYPLTEEKFATVNTPNLDDALRCRIPQSLQPLFVDGVREEYDQESVWIELDPDRGWYIKDVASTMQVQGDAVSPVGLPQGNDGIPPSYAPTIAAAGGIRSINVTLEPIANADHVDYEYHIATASGAITPGDPATVVHLGPEAGFLIRKLPTGTDLQYDTTYYVHVVAKDADGYGPVSAEASASPVQVTGPDIAAEAVTADKILGNTITADKFAATLAMVSSLLVGDRISITPDDGIKIELDDGVIQFPADGSDAYITAAARMKALTVENNLRILGIVNKVEGGIELADGVNAPTIPPQVGYTWSDPSVRLQSQAATPPGLGFWQGLQNYDATYYIVVEALYGGNAWLVNKTTGALALAAQIQENSNPATACSPANDGNIYVLVTDLNRGNNLYVYRYNGNVKQSETLIVAGSAVYPWVTPMMCPDGTGTLRVAYVRASDGKLVVASCAIDGTTKNVSVSSSFATANGIGNNHISGMYAGNADWGVKRLAFTFRGSNYIFVTADAAGSAWDTAKNFERANGAELRGLAWDGTRFHTLDGSGNVYHYSTVGADTSRSVTYTWYDNDATGGTHETQASPARVVTQKKRWWLQVITDPPQDGGGTDDPNAVRIYIANQRQADLGTGITTALYDIPATGGPGAPTSNGFAGVGAPGNLISGKTDSFGPIIELKGDGSGRAGPVEWDAAGESVDASLTVDGGSYTTSAGGPGFIYPTTLAETTFVAPRSGRVMVMASAYLKASADAANLMIAAEVREGNTIRSGAVVYAANTLDAFANYNIQLTRGWAITTLENLVPGATYNAYIGVYRNSAGSLVNNSRIRIVPLV